MDIRSRRKVAAPGWPNRNDRSQQARAGRLDHRCSRARLGLSRARAVLCVRSIVPDGSCHNGRLTDDDDDYITEDGPPCPLCKPAEYDEWIAEDETGHIGLPARKTSHETVTI